MAGDFDVRFLEDGTACIVLTASDLLTRLAEFVDRADRSHVYSGHMPIPGAADFAASVRKMTAITALVPQAEPQQDGGDPPQPRWITTPEAAALTNVTDRAIRKQAATGAIAAKRIGGRWLIDRKELTDRATG